MKMKKCELCKMPARTYCESDEASLCWCCDAKVHGANFLVERHTRTLLCRRCQSPTPWKASGSKLGRIVSVCDRCEFDVKGEKEESKAAKTSPDEAAMEEEGDSDNQVVPWPSRTPPPPSDTSSSSCPCTSNQDHCVSDAIKSLKRTRESSADLQSPIQEDGESSGGDGEVNSVVDCSLKLGRIETEAGSRSVKIAKGFQVKQ